MDLERFPREYRSDIEKAVRILKDAGCEEIYFFGSLAKGTALREQTDIDIGIRGLPPESFFPTYSKLLFSLEHEVDLVDLDLDEGFAVHLEAGGQLERVA